MIDVIVMASMLFATGQFQVASGKQVLSTRSLPPQENGALGRLGGDVRFVQATYALAEHL
jgi:hypothetical protein